MVRTVHRFEQEFLVFARSVNRLERILAVFSIVSRSYIKFFLTNMGSYNLLIAIFFLNLSEETGKSFAQNSAFGQPQGKSLSYLGRECEKFHILANLAVVAFFGFF